MARRRGTATQALTLAVATLGAVPACLWAQPAAPEAVLADQPTTESWRAVRLRLAARPAELRAAIRTGGAGFELARVLDETDTDIERLDRFAPALAPEESAEMLALTERLRILLGNLAGDWANGEGRRLPSTLDQIEQHAARLEELALMADRRVGRMGMGSYAPSPDGWTAPRYPEPAMRAELATYNARELARETESRLAPLLRVPSRDWEEDAEAVGREVGEIARALQRRQGEVPEASRPGFRNAALRLEVISENLVELARRRDRLNFRRQVLSARDANERIGQYLDTANVR